MDPLLLTGSLIAVLALGAFNWWLGRGGGMMRERMDPRRRLDLDLIDFDIGETGDLKDGIIAMSKSGDDLAFAILMGDGWIVRRLEPGFVTSAAQHGRDIMLELDDFSLPRLKLSFEKQDAATIWQERIARLCLDRATQTEEIHHSHGAA